MSPWTTLVAIGVAIVVLGFVLGRVHRRQRPAAGGRGGFLRHFDPADVSEDVLLAVHDQIQAWGGGRAIHPEQDLQRHYGLDPDEIAFAVEQVARRCHRASGAREGESVRTVGDWVRAVSQRPATLRDHE